MLQQLKTGEFFERIFVPNMLAGIQLPEWVMQSGQLTDGHLQEPARAHGALFATLDKHVPDAFIVPR